MSSAVTTQCWCSGRGITVAQPGCWHLLVFKSGMSSRASGKLRRRVLSVACSCPADTLSEHRNQQTQKPFVTDGVHLAAQGDDRYVCACAHTSTEDFLGGKPVVSVCVSACVGVTVVRRRARASLK